VAVVQNSLPLLTSEESGARAPKRRIKTRTLQHRDKFRPDIFQETPSMPTTPRIEGDFFEMTARRDYLYHTITDFAL
jgi:hypothetical protein